MRFDDVALVLPGLRRETLQQHPAFRDFEPQIEPSLPLLGEVAPEGAKLVPPGLDGEIMRSHPQQGKAALPAIIAARSHRRA